MAHAYQVSEGLGAGLGLRDRVFLWSKSCSARPPMRLHTFRLILLSAVLGLGIGCGSTLIPVQGADGRGGAGGLDGELDASSHGGAGGIGGPCWASIDCALDGTCAAPGQQICGGGCAGGSPACQVDSDCAALDAAVQGPLICDPVQCSCGAHKQCQFGCGGNTDCDLGDTCGSDHRCTPTSCGPTTGSCPVDFACAAGFCGRKTCTTDTECSNACVLGHCYSSPGTCKPNTA